MSVKDDLKVIMTGKPTPPPAPKKATLGLYTALEAQRIYNPNIPSVPKPMPAPSKPEDQGTAPKLGADGRWGRPE